MTEETTPDKVKKAWLHRINPMVSDIVAATILFGLIAWAASWRPLHHDEASTWYFVKDGLGPLWEALKGDVHPPLWFLWAWLILDVFDAGFYALRLTSGFFTATGFVIFMAAIRNLMAELKLQNRLDFVVPFFGSSLFAISPFLLFVGYQARYYGAVFLITAVIIYMWAAFYQNPTRAKALLLAVLVAILAQTNYLALSVFAPVSLFLIICITKKRKKIGLLWVFITPCIVGALVNLPLFLGQLAREGASRIHLDIINLFKGIILHGGYSTYCLLMGDGAPPWNPVALFLYIALLIFSLVTTVYCIKLNTAGKWVFSTGVFMVMTTIILSSATMGSHKFLEAPVRATFLWFPWVAIIYFACSAPIDTSFGLRDKIPELGTMFFFVFQMVSILAFFNYDSTAQNRFVMIEEEDIVTTNWAYKVPSKTIAQTAISLALVQQTNLIALPTRSFRNIQYILEQHDPARNLVIFDPTEPPSGIDLEGMIVIIYERRGHNQYFEAINRSLNKIGYTLKAGMIKDYANHGFVHESPSAINLKKRFLDREIFATKLELGPYFIGKKTGGN